MRLKKGILVQMIGGTQMMVSVDPKIFSGIVRSNETAAFIVDHLKKETTEEQLVDALCAEYKVDRAEAAEDVARLVQQFREIGVLEET